MFAYFDAKLFHSIEIVDRPKLIHKLHDLPVLFIRSFDGILRYCLSSALIKVIRDASHKAKLWYEQYLKLFVFAIALDLEQRLTLVGDFEIVLSLIVCS